MGESRPHLPVDAHDPEFGRDGMYDAHAMLVEQYVELRAQRGETSGLDLDELAVGPHKVDHQATTATSKRSPALLMARLDRSGQRSLTQHAMPDSAHTLDRHLAETRQPGSSFPTFKRSSTAQTAPQNESAVRWPCLLRRAPSVVVELVLPARDWSLSDPCGLRTESRCPALFGTATGALDDLIDEVLAALATGGGVGTLQHRPVSRQLLIA
jgi:hypothetical protein